MAQEHLGLFDTPPSPREYRVGAVVVGVLLAASLIVLPVRNVPIGELPAFIPIVTSMMFVSDLIVATLLYSQVSVSGSRQLAVLAAAFLFNGLLLIPLTLTFPGVFSEHGLLRAGVSTAAWLAWTWRLGFPVAVSAYVILDRRGRAAGAPMGRPRAAITLSALAAAALAAAVTALTTLGHDWLPPFFVDRATVIPSTLRIFASIVIALTIIAMIMLFRRSRSVLGLWLFVALCAWLLQAMLTVSLAARFTIGWYSLYIMMFLSTVIVMVALVAEANRLYESLAISVAARNREREDRLMSMDVMAGAMSHEAGQPLSAAMLNMSAALNWLDQPKSDPIKAADSLRAAIEAGRRTFDVIKSVRTTSGEKAGTSIEFDFNDLLRETVEAMRIEFSRKKAAAHLDLDEDLPLVRGDRVQMVRVIVNLLANALEALGSTRRRGRRDITIRSMRSDQGNVLVEIADTGIGIPPESFERIFEPMFTTKKAGAGLGLWLCRTVAEHHSGQLWAEKGPDGGATLKLQVPASGIGPGR